MKHFFLIILAIVVLACGGIEDMPYRSESAARREAWQKLLDTPSYVEAMCREFAASDLSQLVAEECEPQHTYTLLPVQTVGCYYTDADGQPWTTFGMNNATVACADCGEEISRGYSCGKCGEETYHCLSHIEIER